MDDLDPLPSFRYHPDPVGTGSVKAEPDTPCLGCSRIRGYELSKEDAEEFAGSLRKDDQPTAYIFRRLHCDKYLAYVDQT